MNLNEFTITQAQKGLREHSFSSRELAQSCLDRIAYVDARVGAFLEVFAEDALSSADRADARLSRSPEEESSLVGIPLVLKDNMLVQGKRCTSASKMLEPYVAAYNATVVEKLRDQGAVILGKTNMDEFAHGSSTENSALKKTTNPHDATRVPGGSSGGSAAAVAAHECLGALGSDTGGSIRQPASLCGVVGMKPTYGRVSRYGLMAMASSFDQIGPITKTVGDARILYEAVQGKDPKDATTVNSEIRNPANLKGLRLGVPKEFFIDGIDPDVEKSVRSAIDALRGLGAEAVDVSVPTTPYALAVYYVLVPCEVSANLARYDGIRYGLSAATDPQFSGRALSLMDVYCETRAHFGPDVRRRIMIGTYALSAGYYDAYYAKAQKVRTLIRQDFARVFQEVDCLVAPTSPSVAFKFGEMMDEPLKMYLQDVFTVSANVAGIPAISVPCGGTHDLPVGLQFMAPAFGEELLFHVAGAYEQSRQGV